MSHKLAKVIKYNKQSHQASKGASSINAHGRRLGDRPLYQGGIANVATGTFTILMMCKAIGNTFFEGVRRLRPRYKAREPRDDGSERRRPEKNCIPIALAALSMIAALPAFLSNVTHATPYSMTVSIDDSVLDMNVSPSQAGAFSKSSNSTVSVSTTNASGYTLSIASSNRNDGKLVDGNNDDNNTNYLSSITSATTEEQFKALDGTAYNNMWGYLPSKWDGQANTSYLPSPTTTGDVLDHTTVANTTANTYTLSIGARVDATQKVGTYSDTYVILATANGTPYTITYKDNTLSNFPADVSATADGETVTISNQTPVKQGYTFIGWCSVAPVAGGGTNGSDACGGTTYAAGGTWNIDQTSSTNNLTLYAMWQEKSFDIAFAAAGKTKSGGYYLMQDMTPSICNSAAIGQTTMLYDSRDNEAYTIAKLKDGRCWMLDSLRLGSNSESIALTPDDTNITSDYTLPQGATNNFSSFTVAKIDAAYKNDINIQSYGLGSGKVGNYYNYCAASAGTYCYEEDAGIGDAEYDICPARWRMPSGGSNGEIQNLCSAYYGASCPTSTPMEATSSSSMQYNLSILLSGFHNGGGREQINDSSVFWATNHADSKQMYTVFINSNRIYPTNTSIRTQGRSIRCIANSE